MAKSEHEKKALLKKIEKAYNEGFKEHSYLEACEKAGFIELKNKNVVVVDELKNQLGILLDGMAGGNITHIAFDVRHKDRIDLAIRVKGQDTLYDLRLGSESTKNKSS